MRKVYFIASIPNVSKDNTISGVVANNTGRKATHQEVQAIIAVLVERGASQTLVDALRDGTYPNEVVVYERRAAARKEAELLNGCGSCFDWRILSVGDSIRKPVRKPLGWRILLGNTPSTFNRDYGMSDAGGKRVKVEHAHLFDGDHDANYLFRTRELGRALMEAEEIGGSESSYTLVPVYGDA